MVPLAFGTQTAGSLIRPASYCGVWALKPTHGVFSLDGVKGMSPSLDTLGWLANNADDLELMRCALAGETPLALDTVASPRLAAWLTHEAALLDDSGRHAWNQAQRLLAQAGLAPHPVAMPADLARLFDAQKIVMAYEAARTLAPEAAQHRDRLGTALLQLLDGGIGIAEADYRAALALADAGRRWFAAALAGVDALVVPAAPGEAPVGLAATGDPAFSRVWTLLGLPCVAVPGLVGPGGLPVGLQLVGHAGRERALLSVARRLGPVLAGGGQAGA
jgi:Asp-tRNA(Asn)/Glu-tRNA(Gln) amidotransferase A subunit family amidase